MLSAIDTSKLNKVRTASVAIPMQLSESAPAIEQPLFRRLLSEIFRPSVRQGLVVIFDQGFCSITNFLTGLSVARACSKEEYGLYVLGFTLLMTVQGIQTSLSGMPFTMLSPGLKDEDRRSYFGSTLIQHLTLSIVAALGFIIAAGVISLTDRTDNFSGVLLALAAASVFILLRDFTRYALLAQLRVWASLLMGFVANVGTIGLLGWAYMSYALNAPTAYFIIGGCSALPVLFLLVGERKQFSFLRSELRHHAKENWTVGKWLVGCNATLFFYFQIYPLALILLWGSGAAAEYGACMVLMSILNTFLLGFTRFLGPKAVHAAANGAGHLRRIVYTSMLVVALPAAAFFLCLVSWPAEVLSLFFGPKYTGLDTLLVILAIEACVNAIGSPLSAGLIALKETRARFSGGLLAAGLSLLCGLPLVLLLGPTGAALGLLLSISVKWLFLWSRFNRLCQ